MWRRGLSLIVVVVLTTATLWGQERGRKFFPDDPLWEEPIVSAKIPGEADRSEVADFLESTFLRRPKGELLPAANANTVGGVPDSLWFTNRIGAKRMSLSELAKGPDTVEGPDLSKPLTIVEPKTEGITAGFKAKDARGDTYYVKLDPLHYPQLTTSAEVISTKFFHAFGYNVPENYLVFVKRDQLVLAPEARKLNFTDDQLSRLLAKAPRRPDGSYQLLASRQIEGKPLGQFKFWGGRSDDPNDVFPHQDRRELRALRLFAAWLNHVDIDTINTLDVFVGDKKEGVVKHYLMDFGTTLGSGGFEPQRPRVGHEYLTEWGKIGKAIVTLGFWEREWQKIDYPDYPQIGNFEAAHYDPERWRPDYPNPAFDRMREDDAFWAVSIISEFDDEAVKEIVKCGQISDPEAEAYLVSTLLERRNRILAHHLSGTNPIDRFEVSAGRLRFLNLASRAGLGLPSGYDYEWYSYDDSSGAFAPLGAAERTSRESISLPSRRRGDAYLAVEIRTDGQNAQWKRPVLVYLKREGGDGYRVVGVEREYDGNESEGLEAIRILAEKRKSNGAVSTTE